ncbi:MAG: hypothetical protein Q4A39_02005 [Eubacteriales bacterium]|nr:hypothetical protein [Eubacteriales bacterium]
MSSRIARALEAVGTEFTLTSDQCPEGRLCHGVFQPLSVPSDGPVPTAPGIAQQLRCSLAAPPYVFVSGESGVRISVLGRRYALIQAVPRFLGSSLSHWEAALRFLGEEAPAS